MKQLVARHKKELQMFTAVDVPAVERATYLHEFDRAVQYANERTRFEPMPHADQLVKVPALGLSHRRCVLQRRIFR